MSDLESKVIAIESNAQQQLPAEPAWLRALYPPDGSHPLQQEAIDRSVEGPSAAFGTDLFGSSWDFRHELGLLVPHARALSREWHPAIQALLGLPAGEDPEAATRMVIEGYAARPGGARQAHTGLVNQPFGSLLMAHQSTWMGRMPSVMILPALPLDRMLAWRGEAYDAVVVATDAGVYTDIGAADGERLECGGDDPRPPLALAAFRDGAALVLDRITRRRDASQLDPQDPRRTQRLRDAMAVRQTLAAPFPAPGPGALYRLVRFSPGVLLPPGSESCGGGGGAERQAAARGHPAPAPLLLVCRSLNAWLSLSLRRGQLPELDPLPGPAGRPPAGVRPEPSPATGDYDGHRAPWPLLQCGVAAAGSCPRCLARLALRRHPAFDRLLGDPAAARALARVDGGGDWRGAVERGLARGADRLDRTSVG